mgnify:CR=1 FL=1
MKNKENFKLLFNEINCCNSILCMLQMLDLLINTALNSNNKDEMRRDRSKTQKNTRSNNKVSNEFRFKNKIRKKNTNRNLENSH